MNRLGNGERVAVVQALCEGNSIRSTVRMTGISKTTILKLIAEIGPVCSDYQDAVLRNLPCKRIEADEIWTYVFAKDKNVSDKMRAARSRIGDAWTWVAIDADTKLIPCWLVGQRDRFYARLFIDDLASRLANRVQLTTDGHTAYLDAVDMAFGENVDYAQMVKVYGRSETPDTRYSPPVVVGAERKRIKGNPIREAISTSYVERSNLTMRMSMRRFTRLTNGFSKKVENLEHSVALHMAYYNFVRIHGSIGTTPAVAAGVSRYRWTVEDVVSLLEAREMGAA